MCFGCYFYSFLQLLLPANAGLFLVFVSVALVRPIRAAPLFPPYMYDQSGHNGYESSSGSGSFGKLFMNGRHQASAPVHYQELGGGQYPHFAPPPVQYEWRDAPVAHGSSGDDYDDDEYRTPLWYGNKDGYNYGGVGSGRHGRQMHGELFNEHPQMSSPMSFGYLPGGGGGGGGGGGMMKYFNDHELLPSDQHYDNNPIEHSENVPITVLFKTISSPFNPHQQQHIFDLDGGHYEGGGGGGGGSGDHFPHFIHRVTKVSLMVQVKQFYFFNFFIASNN